MSASEGLRLISVTKALEPFQRGDSTISRYFGTTQLAGRAGLLLSALRNQTRLSWDKFAALAANAHLDGPTLRLQILPWLESCGFVERGHGETPTITCNVLDYDAILRETSKLFRNNYPSPEEVAVLGVMALGIRAPTLRSEAFGASGGRDEVVERALEIADQYKILKVLKGPGVKEPVLYSPLIWGDNIAKAGRALSHLDGNRRALVLALIESVRKYQGFPEESARAWAELQGDGGLVDFMVDVGLLDRTEIATKEGERKMFLTTPHLYGEVAVNHGKDVCDRVRLFLDSIRNGQHYGSWHTGKIRDPAALLNRLLDSGEIGPCTAIGSDYILVEKAGVVSVQESGYKRGQFVMRLVQEDTVRLICDILQRESSPEGLVLGGRTGPLGEDLFVPAEQSRARIGEMPGVMKQVTMEMLRSLREMD